MKEIKTDSTSLDPLCKKLAEENPDALTEAADQVLPEGGEGLTFYECVGVGYNLAELAGSQPVFASEIPGGDVLFFIGSLNSVLERLKKLEE